MTWRIVQVDDQFEMFSFERGQAKVYLDTGKVIRVFYGCADLDFPKCGRYITIWLNHSGSFNRKKQPLKGVIIQPIGETELSPAWNCIEK